MRVFMYYFIKVESENKKPIQDQTEGEIVQKNMSIITLKTITSSANEYSLRFRGSLNCMSLSYKSRKVGMDNFSDLIGYLFTFTLGYGTFPQKMLCISL